MLCESVDDMKLVSIKLEAITGLHPAVTGMVDKTASVIYASGPADYQELSLLYLLKLHPIHLTKIDTRFVVVAGFRSYELARLLLHPETEVGCILHIKLKPEEPTLLATVDIFGSPLMHSLGPKYIQQLQALAKFFGNRASIFFPRMGSLRRLRGQNRTTD